MPDRDGIYAIIGDEMAEEIEALRERAFPTAPTHPIRADLDRAVSLIAERVQAGAPRRATGTELAAMRLALGVLRGDLAGDWLADANQRGAARPTVDLMAECAVIMARRILGYARIRVLGYLDYPPHEWVISTGHPWWHADARLLRARLALYLRARLRMERGEMGRWWAVEWTNARGVRVLDLFESRATAGRCARGIGGSMRRARPLWQLARGTEANR